MSQIQCPRCGAEVDELQNIDGALMKKLVEAGHDGLPSTVCNSCFRELAGSVSRGSVIHAQEKAKEQKKIMLWKSRVGMIKRARQLMGEKAFSEAAVQYEKYLRILEVVFDAKPGELTPEHFKDFARTEELTVMASVYWDLLRIYDTSPKYGDRMNAAANKLTQFLRFTPIYPDIIRKAESFAKAAKNPNIINKFVKDASNNKSKCFIASSAFANPYSEEVIVLQLWRDYTLMNSRPGRLFVRFYYVISPLIAKALDVIPPLKAPVRGLLRLFINRALRQ
jgi:hypothetical protein